MKKIIMLYILVLFGCSGYSETEKGEDANTLEENFTKINETKSKGSFEAPVPEKTVTDLHGILFYCAEYAMWGISYAIPNTIDNVNLYLIKNFEDNPPEETIRNVIFSGNCYLSDKTSPIAGTTIFYINIISLTNI
jgi:hypothetical protein